MGTVVRRTNPTEINSAWAPTGADAAGWVYTLQSYDWKGRPLVATNADGTTFEYRYGGCGCAGGEVVTTRDEVGRRRRVTYDALGRVWKTQALFQQAKSQPFADDPAEAVYSTRTNTYNVRDQLTEVGEQEGANGTAQLTTVSYDGHGRPQSSHRPEQDANAFTTFTYNPDDSRATATDGRGVKTIYGYAGNNRGLLTSIGYDLSGVRAGQNVAATAGVTYTYDAAGTRKSMTDGYGTVTYAYDILSRLTSETRVFSDAANPSVNGVTKTLSYGYNLAGQLTSLTDPAGLQVSYTYGRAGQLTRVEGATPYGGVTTYASGIEHRAWGGLREVDYGNGKTLSVSYNSRLQLERYQLPGVLDTRYQYTTTPGGGDNDGRVKFAQDMTQAGSQFDRAYHYDHVGRLTEALTGSEARGGTAQDGPYRESLSYDVWGNLTGRSGRHWTEMINGYSATFVNGRDSGSLYDADGRQTAAGTLQTTYDAAGERVWVGSTQARGRFQFGVTVTQGYGGDGQKVKHKENSLTTYYVRSSVPGVVVAELDYTGQGKRGYVHDGGGGLLATRAAGSVEWKHTDPVTGNERRTNPLGADTGGVEVDPLNIEVGRSNPYLEGDGGGNFSGGEGGLLPPPKYSDMFNGRAGCTIDGAMASCDQVVSALGSGGARRCRNNDRGTRAFTDKATGKLVVSPLTTNRETGRLGYNVPVLGRVDVSVIGADDSTSGRGNEHVIGHKWVDAGAAGDPQNTEPQRPTGDCARFADRVAEIAARHNDVRGFVDELARTFVGVVSADVDVMRENANKSIGKRFTSTGFRAELFDEIGGNQARHFMGGLIAGYNLGAMLGAVVMDHNEDSQADLRVNEISIPLGARLTNPRREEIVDRGDRGGWGRIPATPGFKGLADSIRNQICAR